MGTLLYRRMRLASALGGLTAALAVTGCGGASSTTTASHAAAAVIKTTATPPPPAPHLRILSPRSGARTGQTVTVHVVLVGAPSAGSTLFRYVLDGGPPRRGSPRRTFRDLAPGRHHLVVMLAADASVRGSRSFVVRAPAAAPSPAPAPAQMPPSTPA
ncbi:MAG: hypothetical protein M3016_00485, partial [Actinomycetota bacterium]|nr:hypothetical protein [Actinomycetota bacterium]